MNIEKDVQVSKPELAKPNCPFFGCTVIFIGDLKIFEYKGDDRCPLYKGPNRTQCWMAKHELVPMWFKCKKFNVPENKEILEEIKEKFRFFPEGLLSNEQKQPWNGFSFRTIYDYY
jgi:hypothetical protein